MKRKVKIKLLFLLMIALTFSLFPFPRAVNASLSVIIDGNIRDWEQIGAAVTSNKIATTVNSLHVTESGSALCFLIKGQDMNPVGQIYIDTDYNSLTGYNPAGWDNNLGADYMLENGFAYKYIGTNNSWSWQQVITIPHYKKFLFYETGVPMSSIGINSNSVIRVGYIKNQSATERLPAKAELFPVIHLKNADIDPIAPTAPSNLTGTAESSIRIQLSWDAASDNVGVIGYKIYKDDKFAGYSCTTTYIDHGLTPNTTYNYKIQAYDYANNLSEYCASVNVTTDPNVEVPASTGNWVNARKCLFCYTDDSNIDASVFAGYDMVVFSTGWVSSEKLREIKQINPDIYLFGYISICEAPLLKDTQGNPLDIYFNYPDGSLVYDVNWGVYYVDARKPLWQDMILNYYLADLYAKGFDGAFLDTIDVTKCVYPIDFTPSASGVAELIKKMKVQYPDKRIFMNGGSNLLLGDANDVRYYIDADLIEACNSTWVGTSHYPDGSFTEWYHLVPEGSDHRIYNDNMIHQYNHIRYLYNPDGTVQRDAYGKPVPSPAFFHVVALDYALPGQRAMMQCVVDRSWAYGLIPSIGEKMLYLPLNYDWEEIVNLPPESQFGRGLDPKYYRAFTIDGFVSDWDGIPASVYGISDVLSLTVSNDSRNIYLLAYGEGMNVQSNFYIDVDNCASTGYIVDGWSSSGADYMIENNMLWRYDGNGSNWIWTQIGTCGYAKNDYIVEVACPLTSMEINPFSTIRIGFIKNGLSNSRLPNLDQAMVTKLLSSD